MTLKPVDRISLPPHPQGGEFDHAAVDARHSRLYVAHPSNDCVEIVDLESRRHLRSLPSLKGIAGVWVSEPHGLLFTSNRGEDTVSIFELPVETELARLPTGRRPNGMAFDPGRRLLAVAGVGAADSGAPPTVTFFDAVERRPVGQVELPGRTRWATFHRPTDAFYVNIADPPRIAEFGADDPAKIRRLIEIPGRGPHGMEQRSDGSGLFCACDGGQLVAVDLPSGDAKVVGALVGTPDVLWSNPALGHLYAAIGEPGVVQVFDTETFELLQTLPTGEDAHTLTVDPRQNELHVFLPASHEDLILRDDRGTA